MIRIDELQKAKQRLGKNNGRWKGGSSVSFYRRKAGKRPNDGTVVHHLSKKPKGHYKAKDKVIKISPAAHNRKHPNKWRGSSK